MASASATQDAHHPSSNLEEPNDKKRAALPYGQGETPMTDAEFARDAAREAKQLASEARRRRLTTLSYLLEMAMIEALSISKRDQ